MKEQKRKKGGNCCYRLWPLSPTPRPICLVGTCQGLQKVCRSGACYILESCGDVLSTRRSTFRSIVWGYFSRNLQFSSFVEKTLTLTKQPKITTMEEDHDNSVTHNDNNKEDFGKMNYGCDHYRRRCKLRAPCCNQIFTCRHCHNEFTSALSNPKERHELVRHEVKQVICAVCETEQQVAQVCSNCGVKMGEYFCNICKFYDDNTEKRQFHCDDCGICRVGGQENFFHCQKCASCYSVDLRDNHSCVENSMKSHCPICYEFLFDSVKGTTIMKCGHTIHLECFREMIKQNQYRCPICSKSVLDMSGTWQRIDHEIEATLMPEEYRYKVPILCNDCNNTSQAFFHVFGHKCGHCNSYNTRVITSTDNQQ